jgi:hypothetical protein
VQHCGKWDRLEEGESANGPPDGETSDDEHMLMDHISISTISEMDLSDNQGPQDIPDTGFDTPGEAEAPLLDEEVEEELEYQTNRTYDDDDDDDWWNEYCIPELEPTVEEDDGESEEFEELLCWMDDELDREIGENSTQHFSPVLSMTDILSAR